MPFNDRPRDNCTYKLWVALTANHFAVNILGPGPSQFQPYLVKGSALYFVIRAGKRATHGNPLRVHHIVAITKCKSLVPP